METGRRTKSLQTWRMQLRDKNKVATTLGYGPRYLHSTGQLHKGGPDTVCILSWHRMEMRNYQYQVNLMDSEYYMKRNRLGDFRSLSDKGRRVIYIQLGKNVDKGLKLLFSLIR